MQHTQFQRPTSQTRNREREWRRKERLEVDSVKEYDGENKHNFLTRLRFSLTSAVLNSITITTLATSYVLHTTTLTRQWKVPWTELQHQRANPYSYNLEHVKRKGRVEFASLYYVVAYQLSMVPGNCALSNRTTNERTVMLDDDSRHTL